MPFKAASETPSRVFCRVMRHRSNLTSVVSQRQCIACEHRDEIRRFTGARIIFEK